MRTPPSSCNHHRCFDLGSGAPTRAQDAEKIVDQYIKAQGGAKALSKVQTLTIEGTLSNTADGKGGTYTFDTKLPDRYYSELVMGDRTLIEAYNGKSAWHQTATGEITTLVGTLKARNSKPPASTTIRAWSTPRRTSSASLLSATRKCTATTLCKSK